VTDFAFLADLLSMADGSAAESQARLAAADQDAVARATLGEMLERTRLGDQPVAPVTVQLDLGVPGGRLPYLVHLGPEGSGVEPGSQDKPRVTLRQELWELVRAVFGPPGENADATRELTLGDEPGPSASDPDWGLQRYAAIQGAHLLVAAAGPQAYDLNQLAVRFGSDKWGGHWHTPHYANHFAAHRERRVSVLELGIGGYDAPDQGGSSLLMWRYYFRRGLIHGLDIFDKSQLPFSRVQTHQGDQSDSGYLTGLAERIGPLDIVIDDGSHFSPDVISSFHALFPFVRPGGLYVIEDLQTSYWPGWEGSSTDLHTPTTSMGFLKTLVDGLNHQEQIRTGPYQPSYAEQHIRGIALYHNIAFIEKGTNAEQGAPSWVPRFSRG
jgi:demethylmacrocin O-methyltransferase